MQRFMSYEQKSCSFSTNTGNSSNSSSNSNSSNNNSEDILKQFPKIKFSYESKPYKKVSQNKNNNSIAISNNESEQNKEFYFIIPKGKKYLVWFKNNECYFLELDAQRKIVSITKKNVSHAFPNNTILYGTHFYIRRQQQISNGKNSGDTTYYFTIENIHYYNGLHLNTTSVFDKFKKIDDFFKQQQQQQQPNSQNQHHAVEIGLPHVSSSFKGASDIKPFYSAFCIQKKDCKNTSNEYENVFYFNSVYNCSSVVLPAAAAAPAAPAAPASCRANIIHTNNNGNNGKYKMFTVRADLQNDVYHLSNPDDDDANAKSNEQLIASIPDYKTSVMMNSLFRNIKENKSLDALEESDDEDEFENVNIDKFVDLSKKIKMKCVYNYKFKKWTPVAQMNE